jgi:hypothetical protein
MWFYPCHFYPPLPCLQFMKIFQSYATKILPRVSTYVQLCQFMIFFPNFTIFFSIFMKYAKNKMFCSSYVKFIHFCSTYAKLIKLCQILPIYRVFSKLCWTFCVLPQLSRFAILVSKLCFLCWCYAQLMKFLPSYAKFILLYRIMPIYGNLPKLCQSYWVFLSYAKVIMLCPLFMPKLSCYAQLCQSCHVLSSHELLGLAVTWPSLFTLSRAF